MKTYAVKTRRECGDNASLAQKLASPIAYYYISAFDRGNIIEHELPERYATLHAAQKACEDKRRKISRG